MCTVLRFKQFFGRNLDYEFSYGEKITVSPRNYNFKFRHTNKQGKHYAIIGMAYIVGDYPLYYDAINEKGVGMAGLNFVGNMEGITLHPLSLFHGYCLNVRILKKSRNYLNILM